MLYGWSGRILRVDLSNKISSTQDTAPYIQSFIGGKGINVKVVYDEVGAEISPFDSANRLCLGPGVLAGTLAPASSRTEITAMSPRGLLDSAGIGGFIGAEIRYAGYDAVIIQGKAENPVYIYIHDDWVEFKDASHIWGKDPWETQEMIRDELGNRDIQAICIGCAGENLVRFACITTGRLSSVAGRCGLGAIMGSKNLKAIAVRGTRGIRIAKGDEFTQACLEFHNSIRQNLFEARKSSRADKTIFSRYIDISGKFVSGNWEKSNWHKDGFYNLVDDDPEVFWSKYAEHQQPRGMQQPGCHGCPTFHETYFNIPGNEGIGRTKCVQWLSLSGPIWLVDRKQVIRASYLCDKYGLDAVSTGNCISFLMELYHRGIITEKDSDGIPMRRGDINAIISAIHKIGNQEGFGKLFKNGVLGAAKEIGRGAEDYAMQVKGLELYTEEVRAYKSMALLASVGKIEQYSNIDVEWAQAKEKCEKRAMDMFGRKDAAFTTSYEGKALLVWDSENRHCVTDLLGLCKFIGPWGYTLSLELPAKLLSPATGIDTSEEALLTAAQRVRTLERAFNVVRGIRRKDDIPPKRLFEEPVSDGKFKGETLDKEQFDNMLGEYYTLCGYDADGIPMEETFEKLGLSSEWKALDKVLSKNERTK